MLVLGVDPGSNVTGYGLIERLDHERMICVHAGHIGPPGSAPFYAKVHHIFREMGEILRRYRPEQMAIEDIFYAKNVKSSLKLGHARGAVLIAATQAGIPIFEYSPLEIKKAVVGYGRASKEQVRAMVQMILQLQAEPTLDTSDALATAICHIHSSRLVRFTGGVSLRR
jgi:crossover junction endodeoxyribonuclease RuvC